MPIELDAEEIEDIIEIVVDKCLEIASKDRTGNKCAIQTIVVLLTGLNANIPEIRTKVIDAVRAEGVALVDSAAGFGGSGRLNLK